MQEIKCPNCGKVFQVDESGYSQIVQQIRDKEFNLELERREQELSRKNESDLTIAKMEQEKKHSEELSAREAELAEKESEIEKLKAQLLNADTEKKLAVSEAIKDKDKEISEKGNEINILKSDLELQKREFELRESNLAKENELKETNLTRQFQGELKLRDEEIERLKDFKARQSTKMVGESLEQHCQAQFNQIRMTAFPNAVFEKDNDDSSGSKGDFIFRESSEGTEFISIMFEMKNEMDTTKTKHKNEDFFKELDKDRKEKNCEYAVLVSMLESDNELYNNGIVDVSYRYPKMFVVRPQFFIPIISLLRNAALNSLEYRQKLEIVQNQEIELSNFEENLATFKKSFADSFRLASERYEDAISGIDKAIASLNKIKDFLMKSENHLRIANNKAEDISIKKLTKNAPSVRAMLEENKNNK